MIKKIGIYQSPAKRCGPILNKLTSGQDRNIEPLWIRDSRSDSFDSSHKRHDIPALSDFIIVLGGDGPNQCSQMIGCGTPILGVNLGSMDSHRSNPR